METRYQPFVFLVSLLFGTVAGNCNVCRNGGRILNPGHTFVMEDPTTDTRYTWECGYLEEALADVNAIDGAPGEAYYCALAQLWADRACECSGEPLPPDDNVVDPNPSCNLCGTVDGQSRELNYVPGLLRDELVETGVAGRMPCGGLYHALSENILPSNLCPIVQRNAGEACCSIPRLDLPEDLLPPEETCLDLGEDCENGGECCGNFICRTRGIGVPKICSAVPRGSRRQSVARAGAGGAAGRAKGNG